MALTHEQAGHLLHPTMWFSAANSSLALTSDWSDSTGSFSTPVTEQWNYYGRPGRYAWLAVASVDSSLDPGVGGLFKMPDGGISTPATWWGFEFDTGLSSPTLSFVDMTSNGDMGGVNGAPPRVYGNQQLEFELLSGNRFVIRAAGSQWCLTAGSSPASTATAGQVALTEYEGAANQIWECYGSSSLIGFYDVRSYASSGSLVITTPGDVPTNLVQLGLASPRPESASQTYRLIEPSLDSSQAPRKFIAQQARGPQFVFNLGLAQTGVWTVRPINQLVASGSTRSILRAPETSSESWTADSISYDALHLSFQNYSLDTSGPARVPFEGGLWGADEYPESPQQAWIPVPRNVYDAGLPTPSALSVIVENEDFGETFETTSRCSLSIDDEVIRAAACTLKFALSRDHEFFQVGVAERYMQEDATWSDWISYIRTPGVSDTTSLEPGWGVAWVPNAFAAAADTDGRVGIDVTGVSLSASRPRIQMRYMVRAFEYSDAGVPTVGPASTIIIDFSAKGYFEIDGSPMVGIDGLHVPYRIDYYTGPTRLHFDSVFIGSVEAIRDFDTSASAASGTLLVPWTAFSELDATWMQAAGTMIRIYGESSDLFGTSSIATSRALIADEDATVVAGTMSSNPIFTRISTGVVGAESKIFCVVDSESAQRVIEMPGVVTPPALDYAAILDGEQQTTTRALIITGDSIVGPGSEYHAASFDIPRPSRCVTTLAYESTDGVVIIAVEGNVSSGFSLSRDVSTARRVGANAFELGALPGASPELELQGTLYRGQLASFPVSSSQSVKIASTIQEACRIPADTTCVLRTAYGTCHRVRVVGVSAPRSARDQGDITFSLVEVDD